jgi:hypothetical protein
VWQTLVMCLCKVGVLDDWQWQMKFVVNLVPMYEFHIPNLIEVFYFGKGNEKCEQTDVQIWLTECKENRTLTLNLVANGCGSGYFICSYYP